MVNTVDKKQDPMPVLIAGIHEKQLLLPSAVVAEIIDYQTVQQQDDDQPTWYLGTIDWRGINLPLISLENLNNNTFFTQSHQLKIVVVHALENCFSPNYWGFIVIETPRMLRLEPAQLQSNEQHFEEDNIAKTWVDFAGDILIVPNLYLIESKIAQLATRF